MRLPGASRARRALLTFVTSATSAVLLSLSTGCGSGDHTSPTTDAGSDTACPQSAGPATAGAAKSAGYTGTDGAFLALFNVPCTTPADCTAPCVAAGGTMGSCASSSLCDSNPLFDGGSTCIPPAYWLKTGDALSTSDAETGAAEVVLVDTPYHDALVLTDFGLSVPDGTTVTGIQFDLQRNSDQGETVDGAVQVLLNGMPMGADHSAAGPWPSALTDTTFGGRTDTWGVSWSPADVRSSGFGLSIAPKFTATKGNDRAHIDSVHATVFFSARCN